MTICGDRLRHATRSPTARYAIAYGTLRDRLRHATRSPTARYAIAVAWVELT
ncbi:hypothetical protein H6G91_16410 [Nostoc muscorum FACHB-395]|nr:hypothetical protein [Desmonostoc muscorum FACHB-395]